MKKKYSYVLVFLPSDGIKQFFPYPEVQEFCSYDLSKDVVYLSIEEMNKYNEHFKKEHVSIIKEILNGGVK